VTTALDPPDSAFFRRSSDHGPRDARPGRADL